MRLQIDVFDNQKIVAVWLTKAERDDERVREKLRELRAEYKAKKYTVAEYQSGDGDLHTSIYELLRYNKLRVAEPRNRARQSRSGARCASTAKERRQSDREVMQSPRGAPLPGGVSYDLPISQSSRFVDLIPSYDESNPGSSDSTIFS